MQTVLVKIVFLTCFVFCLSINNDNYVRNENAEHNLNNELYKKIVRLSPNPSFDGNIVIESFVPDALSFYLFDKEANLIRQIKLKGNSSHAIQNLKKGTYIYDVFLNEVSIENGNIHVK
jgi:hypothetical protein